MDFNKDYYKILQVNKDASKEEIRLAYRRLVKLHHPDLHGNNPANEEIIKEINEANEVLGNDTLRREYDDYVKMLESLNIPQKDKEDEFADVAEENKRTTYKTKTFIKETPLYIKGRVILKYYGDKEEEIQSGISPELLYKIYPTDVRVTILEEDIFIKDVPTAYRKAYSASDIFRVPVKQPVKCTVVGKDDEEYYELQLEDIRLANIVLSGVTKHENASYGTLEADIYAFHPKKEKFETVVEHTECFGPTGKVQTKVEDGFTWLSKEYYNNDCTTFWGPWVIISRPEKAGRTNRKPSRIFSEPVGCAQYWWLFVILLLVILFPRLFLGFLGIAIIGLLFYAFSAFARSFSRIIPLLVLLALGLFIYGGIRAFGEEDPVPVKKEESTRGKVVRSTFEPDTLTTRDRTGQTTQQPDTLITHLVEWEDYSKNAYQANLSIYLSDLRKSMISHTAMQQWNYQSIAPVYAEMLANDTSGLRMIYSEFDTLRARNGLDEVAFARAIVSCVQSIPYYLVVDNNCDANQYDGFIRNYMQACNNECCVGNELFGVRMPLEFVSDLKGDCDTRSLLLYGILKHFGYNVALLTSNYYQHALIAVAFRTGEIFPGLSMNIQGDNYFLWETTSAGLDLGEIPPDIHNLDHWTISLLNKGNNGLH